MKIIHSLEGESWSGGQQQAFFLAKGQQELGHDVLLMCQKGSVLEKRARESGLNVWPVNYFKEINPLSMYQLYKAYKEFKPEIVNVHRAWAHTQWLLVSLLTRFRGLIVTRRVLFKPDSNPVSLVKYRTPAIRGYIAVSEAVEKQLEKTGVKTNRIEVVYSATDTDRFSPESKEPLEGEWPVREAVPACLMVGNYSINKGHHLLLDAFKELGKKKPDLHLVLAGHGTDSEKLKKYATGHPFLDRIHFLGFRADVPALMKRADFTINASYKEGLSGTVRESLALNVPVLASDIPGNLEIGKLVPIKLFKSGDPHDLSEKAACFLDELKSFKDSRERTVANFSVSSMVQKTINAYRKFLKK